MLIGDLINNKLKSDTVFRFDALNRLHMERKIIRKKHNRLNRNFIIPLQNRKKRNKFVYEESIFTKKTTFKKKTMKKLHFNYINRLFHLSNLLKRDQIVNFPLNDNSTRLHELKNKYHAIYSDIFLKEFISVRKNEKARKPSLVVEVDFGEEIGIKQSSAQITHYYNEENLKGKQVIGVCNFAEKNIAGVVSQVLILGSIDKEGKVILVHPSQKSENGLPIA
jgi:tRNA-binding protein